MCLGQHPCAMAEVGGQLNSGHQTCDKPIIWALKEQTENV